MRVSVIPVLELQLEIYESYDRMDRYALYQQTMKGDNDKVPGRRPPLGAFSPMGKFQPDYLTKLINIEAEKVAAEEASKVAIELSDLPDRFDLAVVVVDDKPNGWTPRFLADAESRFLNKYDDLSDPLDESDRWVSVQLWTFEEPTVAYIQTEVRAAIYRASFRRVFGPPVTLDDVLKQEGNARRFAGDEPTLDAEEIAYSAQVIKPLRKSDSYPLWFSAFYGDEIAQAFGYQAFGLSDFAGLDVSLAGTSPTQAVDALRSRIKE